MRAGKKKVGAEKKKWDTLKDQYKIVHDRFATTNRLLQSTALELNTTHVVGHDRGIF